MIIPIPFKTPTINHAYWHRGNMKIINSSAKKIRTEILKIVDKFDYKDKLALKDQKLGVDISIFEDWYYKNGNIRKTDVANREKFLIDSIMLGLGLDDKMIFYLSLRKIQSETEEKAIITIEEL